LNYTRNFYLRHYTIEKAILNNLPAYSA